MTDSNSKTPRKIGYVVSSFNPKDEPATRISALNIFSSLRQLDYEPSILYKPPFRPYCGTGITQPKLSGLTQDAVSRGFQSGDFVYFQKVWGDSALEEIAKLKNKGCRILFGVCDILRPEMVEVCDATFVVSEFAKALYPADLQKKIHVVHDGIECPDKYIETYSEHYATPQKPIRAVLMTSYALQSIPAITSLPDFVKLTVIGFYPKPLSPLRAIWRRMVELPYHPDLGNKIKEKIRGFLSVSHPKKESPEISEANAEIPFERVNWELEKIYDQLVTFDVGMICQDMSPNVDKETKNYRLSKSNNRLTQKMALGLPVITSPLPSYLPILENGVNGFIADSQDDWDQGFQALRDPQFRQQIGVAARERVLYDFSQEEQARKIVRILDQL